MDLDSSCDDRRDEDDSILARWAAELADRLRAGEIPNLEKYTREHPALAEQLRKLLPAIAMMAQLGTAAHQVLEPGDELGLGEKTLGGFRLLREVGRGGMGVVYEALEVPLGRRVALKVLPLAAALDPRQVKRFQLEAQAVASLNHRNIVPIFSVGRDRGVAFFAMQFIDGRTLADVNRELRQFDKRGRMQETVVVSDVTRSLLKSRPPHEVGEEVRSAATTAESEVVSVQAHRASSSSSSLPTRGRTFFRTVAGLGRQAAEALAHVHDLGIQHRDIKPANLLVDTHGHLWVTDFGLARLQGDGEQTRTGDVVGTLRYMSPEQALARSGMIDHRTDIYSLGATLYELLTLRPAYGGDDRQDLLLRIVHEEPVPPRRLDPTIPIDLETIVSKAMAKEPSRRYATAQELADDLTRFLEGRLVLARRPSPVDGVTKWMRRRWPLVATAAVLTLFFAGISIAGLAWSNARLRVAVARADRNARDAEGNRRLAQEGQELADRLLGNAQIRLADQALDQDQIERAQDILEGIRPSTNALGRRHFVWRYLWRLATREIVLLRGHDNTVRHVGISPDGRSLVTLDDSQALLLWDVASGRRRGELTGKMLLDGRPRFSPDSRFLMAPESAEIGSETRQAMSGPALVVWEASTGRRLARLDLSNRAGRLHDAEFVMGGRALAIQWLEPNRTQSILLWRLVPELSRPQLSVELQGLEESRFSSDGRLCCTLDKNQLQLRDITTGAVRRRFLDIEEPGLLWEVSPNGRLLVISSPTRGTLVQDTDSGIDAEWQSHTFLSWSPVFSANSQVVAAEGEWETETIELWDRSTGHWRTLSPAQSGTPRVYRCALSPDGTRLALSSNGVGGGGGPVTLWDVATRRLLKTFPGRLGGYSTPVFAADGRSIFLACMSEVCRWYPESADSEMPLALAGHTDEAWAVAFSPNGEVLASGSDDTDDPQTIKLWDRASGRFLRGWKGHPGTVSALAFSPDGHTLATGALLHEDNASLWDVATGRLRAKLVGHTQSVRTVAYSPAGRLLATAGSDCTIRIWDSATGRLQGILSGHTEVVHHIAFSPDGWLLASAGNDRSVRIWDVAGKVQRYRLDGLTYFMALAFSPDGSLLATTDGFGRITLWDPTSGASLGKILCDDGDLRTLTFSPDGALLAAAGTSRAIHLWDAVTRQELVKFAGHQHQVNSLAFTPDGLTLASCSHDGAIKLWDAGPQDVNHPIKRGERNWGNDSPPVDFNRPSTYFQKEE